MALFDFVLRSLLAVALGFVIGLERQLTGHVPGIRINVLVSLGTSMFVMFSALVDTPDMTRIAAQIVTGVGFLCSGIIFKEGGNVRGLNTAATIWCTAAIGMLCSSSHTIIAVCATALLICANVGFRFLSGHISPFKRCDEQETYYKFTLVCEGACELKTRSLVMNIIKNTRFTLMNLASADMIGGKVEIEATLYYPGKSQEADVYAEKLIGRCSACSGISRVGWETV